MIATRPNKLAVVEVTLVLWLALMAFVLQRHASLLAGCALCAAYAVFAFRASALRIEQVLLGLLLMALLLPAFFKPYFELTPAFYFFNTVATLLAAIALTRHPPSDLLWALRAVFASSIVLIAWALYTHWGVPEPLGEVIPGSSTNGIPAYLIVVQVGLSLCNFVVHRRLPLASAIATCVVAFYGYGRGSLVVAALIVVVSLAYNLALWRSARVWHRFVLLLLTALLVASLLWFGDDLVGLVNDYTKLGIGLVDVNRQEIWEHYAARLDGWTLLFGADYRGTVIETERQGNPHIAYIRTHALFGLPATLLAMASPAFVFLSRKALGAKIVFATFIGLAALRAASEPILFPTLLDLYYFSFFLLFFRHVPDRHAAARLTTA